MGTRSTPNGASAKRTILIVGRNGVAGTRIKSHELIGYDANTKAFASYVYSNMAAEPWPYTWEIQGDTITIAITYGQMNAKFTGTFSRDNQTFAGGWRPNPGADLTINAPYDIAATRIE